MLAEGLANATLDPVPPDRLAHLLRDGDADPAPVVGCGADVVDEPRPLEPSPATAVPEELPALPETPLRREGVASAGGPPHGPPGYFPAMPGARRLRPFRRRLASTFRPDGELHRFKNPWFFRRFRLLG